MEPIAPLLTAYCGVVGLVLGSFINLVADRVPRGESIVTPGSHCRACGRRLNVVDLLPVAGYLVRGGKCATCRAPIGVAAPLVEVGCASLMIVPILLFGLGPGAAVGLILVAAYGAGVTGLASRRAGGGLPS